ncbi:uncharacterized protein [Nicotiana sylvestris]|uniref:uncharacterized protein n=1 Tax=Nicotiana sylvestris TaxID=4096 RepID=UPI00388C4D5D
MKKGVPFKWDQACSNVFESIKSYLMKPPILAAPIPGKPLILYIATQERSVGALLARENSEGKENSLYYLSRMMTPNELNYSPIENLRLALVFSIQKQKHYFQAHVVRLVSKANPIKFVMSKPVLSDRLARGAGASVVFVTSQGEVLPYSFTLTQLCSNNVSKYQTLILGLEMAIEMKRLQLQVFGDSQLVVNQLLVQVTVCKKWVVPPPSDVEGEENELKHLVVVFEVEKEEWRQPIIDYLCYGILPENPRRITEIRRRAPASFTTKIPYTEDHSRE